MKVKFKGKTQIIKNTTGDITIVKGSVFEVAKWHGIDSVLNEKDEWICDIDSKFFKDNFQRVK